MKLIHCMQCEKDLTKKQKKFCSCACRAAYNWKHNEEFIAANKRNLASANTHPNSLKARRKNMKEVAHKFNELRSNNPSVEVELQRRAAAGRKASPIAQAASQRNLDLGRYGEKALRKKSLKAAERAQKYGIASCRRSIRVDYEDRKGRLHHMRSLTECRYALHLDLADKDWDYEPCILKKPDDRRYIPDFYIEGEGYVEVKGYTNNRLRNYYESIASMNNVAIKLVCSRDFDAPNLTGVLPGSLIRYCDQSLELSLP